MVKFKTPNEMAARRAFIAGADKDGIIQQDSGVWSFSDLKNLTNDELIERLEQVDNQATLIKWRILWALRQRFPSDKLFGQYISDLKATRAICAGSHQEINRALHAGRFCEKYGIVNLSSVGLLQSSVYALSRPANETIADEVYKKIKNKNVPIKDVERYIEQAKAVLTIDEQSANPEQMPYENSLGIDDGKKTQLEITESLIPLSSHIMETAEKVPSYNHQRRMAILATLPPLSEDELSNEEILEELKTLCFQFMKPLSKIIQILTSSSP
ncbi:hypothetical protein [Methylocucumis oryzae]|uniref:Uncharacterized protein n=1 Tax=Methylocucumis oryzae TaxID=1632867 RepID=A0A0F3IEF9_9GAMM|nr:hypothetical protein [Methylocucumis oryzae]KJV05131.1 hypothetical protein VZ94_20395 [Methylocucumis oryzae]